VGTWGITRAADETRHDRSEVVYRAGVEPIGPTLHALARAHPERVALVAEDGRRWTLGALDRLARQAQRAWSEREVVALRGDNGPELVVAFLGALYAGRAVHPLHASTPDAELVRRGLAPAPMPDLAALAALEPAGAPVAAPADAPALALSTSGTTGAPRDVVIGHGGLGAHTRAVAATLGLGPGDRVLGVLPLAHSYGCRMALLAPLVAGAEVHVAARFSARGSLALVRARGLTWAPVVPTMLAAWAALPDEEPAPTTLRWILSAGAPLPEAVRVAVEARLGVEVRQGYGLSEASFACIDAPREGRGRASGSVGPPVPGVEVRLGPRDEIMVRGANLMLGYRDAGGGISSSRLTTEAGDPAWSGWLATGDVGRWDDDGNLYVIDRLKDIVLVGGHTVHPAEVEAALHEHPGVLAAAVVGAPDPYFGEVVEAHVVPRGEAGRQALDVAELEAFVRARVAAYKVPTRWRLVAALPVGASGKVVRRALRST